MIKSRMFNEKPKGEKKEVEKACILIFHYVRLDREMKVKNKNQKKKLQKVENLKEVD